MKGSVKIFLNESLKEFWNGFRKKSLNEFLEESRIISCRIYVEIPEGILERIPGGIFEQIQGKSLKKSSEDFLKIILEKDPKKPLSKPLVELQKDHRIIRNTITGRFLKEILEKQIVEPHEIFLEKHSKKKKS